MFRDRNFDVREMFGIEVDELIGGGEKMRESPRRGGLGGNNSYLERNRVREI